MRTRFFLVILASCFLSSAKTQIKNTAPAPMDSVFKTVKWRSIGPFRGGRSVCATGVVGNNAVYYMGTTGGGVWKTEDMGITWNNISDGYFKTGSVGAVAVAASDPNMVYVGMGEHAVRGVMTSPGDGVYRSTDAGKSWKKMGLDATQHIARIAIDPKDPNTVYVAAQGALYGPSAERGVYKSTDAGVTWKKVLYVDEKTGCAELSMDRNNPRILYAAMWEHGRQPWKITSGGPGSGLYKSTDAGEHWEKIQEGLPKELGKMSIAVCGSNSEKVYALIESDSQKEQGGLFASEDAGKSWTLVSSDHRLVQRAWYYIELFPDPNNENVVYVMSAQALRSIDGGKTWEDISNTHGDYHNLWINPSNSNNMIISDDGGSAITLNQGKTWSSQDNQPTAQIYRINVDNQFPYNIYGGQQDNTAIRIASRELGGKEITPNSWSSTAGGESAFLAFNPDSPRYVLGGSYEGTIEVVDSKAKAGINIMAAPIQFMGLDASAMKYRFNWNAPIIWSQHEPNVFYHGAQLLLRTADTGRTWTEVSPDLTRNDKSKQGKPGGPYTNEAVGAENYGTLSYIKESPHEKGVIWTGSDDGYVYLTKDYGAHWQNVTPAGLPECLINEIEVSPHDKATAYIATTRYKFNDHSPAIYKTTDYGKSWTKIINGIAPGAFTRVIREDDQRKDLLFAGTEKGLYISWNGGKEWIPFQMNLPVTPITDLCVHNGDLVAATSGRGFWILDDLGLVRQYKQDTGFLLYQPEDAYIVTAASELDKTDPEFKGSNKYAGVNPATGVVIYYQLADTVTTDTVTLEIRDAKGRLVRSFSSVSDSTYKKYEGGPPQEPVLTNKKGMNRFVWNMRYATIPGIPDVYIEASYAGHKAAPGQYTYTLKTAGKEQRTTSVLKANPLYALMADSYAAYDNNMSAMEEALTNMHTTINNLYAKQQQLADLLATLPHDPKFAAARIKADTLLKKMQSWDEEMVQRKSKAYDDVENFENKFTSNYLYLLNQTETDMARVNQSSLDLLKDYNTQWAALKTRADEMLNNELPALNKMLWDAGVGAVWKR